MSANESFEKNRTTRRKVFGSEVLFFGKDLREDPREARRTGWGEGAGPCWGLLQGSRGWECWEVCLAGPWEHPQLAAPLPALADHYLTLANAWSFIKA